MAGLALLRGIPLLILVALSARPFWTTRQPPAGAARPVVLLMDRSESMSLEENERSRYQHALGFAREHLLPALKSAGLYEKVKSKLVFGESISQAAQFVQSGNAEIGVLAASITSSPAFASGH